MIRIDDWQRAQDLADRLSPDRLHLVLDRYAAQCCPVLDIFRQSYHWSLMQVEYATDLVFRSVGTLRPLYEHLARESVLSVKAEQIASFLGRQISPQLAQEIGSQFSTRIEGTCIKHRFASSSIKMYDKYGCVLRIETTINNVSFFKHHRKSLPPRRCFVPEDWRDGARLWQAVSFLKERLLQAQSQLVPVVHRRDPRARAATVTSLAERRAGGPCGPTGASVSASRSRRPSAAIEGSTG